MKLIVVAGPYWYWSMRPLSMPEGTECAPQSLDPLDEHHSYFYSRFLKHGIVDEVLVYSARRKLDTEQGIPQELEYYGGRIRLVYDDQFEFLKQSKNQLVYCREPHARSHLTDQHVQMVKFLTDGFPVRESMRRLPFFVPYLCRERHLNPQSHHLFLAEGPYNRRYAPRQIRATDWPTLSSQDQYVRNLEKRYDWVIVGSLTSRKRVVETVELLARNGLGHLKGLILSSSALSHLNKEKGRYEQFLALPERDDLDVEIRFNSSCKDKMELLCQSRMLISSAAEDSGPRAVIEAGQAGIPVVGLHHHGCCSLLVRPGVNGELSWRFEDIPAMVKKVLDHYDGYDCSVNRSILDPDQYMTPIINHLDQLFHARGIKLNAH